MEWPVTETYRTCVDPVLGMVEHLLVEPHRHGPYMLNEIQTVLMELSFSKMFFWGLDHQWQASEEYDSLFRSVWTTCAHQLRQIAKEFSEFSRGRVDEKDLQQQIRDLPKRIKPFKLQAKEICILLLGGEIRCKSCHCQQDLELFLEYGRETASFIGFLLENLEALNSKFHLIAPVQQQIDFITGKLKVFGKFANPVSHSITRLNNLGELVSQTRTWANHLSCLACLYWIDGLDESLASTMGTMFSHLLQKTLHYTPGVVASYFEPTLIPQLLASYFDFLLEEMVQLPTNDDIETLREGLIFLLSFMIDPPEEDSEDRELILEQIYSIINELPFPICSIHYSEMKERISESTLSDFLEKIAGVESEVRKLYAITPSSSEFNCPRTNAIGFLDSLLQKLEKWLEGEVNLMAHVKHGIQTVLEELASLRPFMQHITLLQNEEEELDELWNRIVNVVYYAAYVTNLCPPKSLFLWFGCICLPIVIEETKLIRNEVREINDPLKFKSRTLNVEKESRDNLLPRATTSKVEGAFIGFREDTRSIINHLTRGLKNLTIISISGMPGQGKTTLAKKIYNDPEIQYHFHKTVWCYVSKECKIRELIIDILHNVSKSDEDLSKKEIQDLAESLRKRLKGRRYLIVMDDIWDVGVWCQVQSSFPDDRIGSRILFTSRNHNLKSEAKLNFISYPLRSFSEEESWDLMKERLFDYNGLDPEFVEIGKQIAICCKGLPLAIALVSSLLGKTQQKLEFWNQVAENLKSHLASEGCMHIMELSYKYLPNNLKSCFLYFGAFPRGENIRARRLKLLWIAEGFIKGNETRYSENLADECLDYLVSQSLIVVVERSSLGGIKRCNVHDLLYDLCLEKIVEENFLHLVDRNTVFNESGSNSPQKYGHHRLSFGDSDPFIEARPICRRKELPTSPVQSLLWLDIFFSGGNDFNGVSLINFLKSFKVLTVLDLAEVRMAGDVFPEVILCNIHLKYLALWECFKDIPPSIAKLCNLETLILRGGPYRGIRRRIPYSMWGMKSLSHVRIDNSYLTLEDFEENELHMAAQHNMETLCGLILRDDPHTAEFFGRMTRLRKLKCLLQGDLLHPTCFSIFGSLEKLEQLKIQHYFSPTKLDLRTCSSFPQNIRKLSLERLNVASWSAMPRIWKHLPNLEVLKLLKHACVGRRWDLEDGEFSKLRYLELNSLYALEQINVSGCDNPFPCLEQLLLENCRGLEEIPSSFGDICTLNSIKMNGLSREASKSVMQILKTQRDLGNLTLRVFGTSVKQICHDDNDLDGEGQEGALQDSN